MVTWITGPSGIGKTTLARKLLAAEPHGVLLDGDDMRKCWTLGFSLADRVENNLRIAKLAHVLDLQGVNVIVATICPYASLRKQVQAITGCRFIVLPATAGDVKSWT